MLLETITKISLVKQNSIAYQIEKEPGVGDFEDMEKEIAAEAALAEKRLQFIQFINWLRLQATKRGEAFEVNIQATCTGFFGEAPITNMRTKFKRTYFIKGMYIHAQTVEK